MNNTILNIDLILKVTCGRMISESDFDPSKRIKRFSIDSRNFAKNDVFIAIKGQKFDGHDFVKDISTQSPTCVIISEEKAEEFKTLKVPVISVKNTVKAMRQMSQCAIALMNCAIIEITGSIGKTTTRNMLFNALKTICKTSTQEKNFNNEIGLPLSIINFTENTELAILEIGMNNFGEIKNLTNIPLQKNKITILTNIASNHLSNFSSMRDIALAKTEIFKSMNYNDTAILFRDMPFFNLVKSIAKKNGVKKFLTYGRHKKSDLKISKIENEKNKKIVSFTYRGQEISYCLPFVSDGVIINSLAVFAVLFTFKKNIDVAIKSLKNFSAITGRGNIETFLTNRIINEAYSSGPESLRNAVKYLFDISKTRKKIAIIGDMLELGVRSSEIHKELSSCFDNIDYLFTIGKESQNIIQKNNNNKHFNSIEEFLDNVGNEIGKFENTDILIKGSNLMRMQKIVQYIKQKYNKSSEN